MRISAVIQLARQYLLLGVIGATILIGLFLVGYFVVYKKQMKGTKKLNLSKVGLWTVFLIYITIVMGATLLDRSSGFESANLHLFSSYIDAYNSFSLVEWRNIILNILMFVPLGFILPLLFKKCERWYITYTTGLGATLFIEIVQYISKRGVFELDDIMNNALGCIIGYGLVMFINSIVRRKEEKHKISTLVTYQAPLMFTIISFSILFINYSNQELGNLSFTNSYKMDMSKIKVSTKLKLDEKSENTYVYEAPVGSKDDVTNVAREVFLKLNTEIDESQNDEYDNTIAFKYKDEGYNLWVDNKGLTTWFTDFSNLETKGKENLTYKEVQNLLRELGIELHQEGVFKENGDGVYSISFNMVKSGDVYLDGELTCNIGENDKVSSFTNNIISYKPYKEYEILSMKEAYDKILSGDFKDFWELEKNIKMDVVEASLSYALDSKGFYQPYYDFRVKVDGKKEDISISIPALKL
ncbi:MAG: VanZ family protein [Peptostreptococcaceae bacterium]